MKRLLYAEVRVHAYWIIDASKPGNLTVEFGYARTITMPIEIPVVDVPPRAQGAAGSNWSKCAAIARSAISLVNVR